MGLLAGVAADQFQASSDLFEAVKLNSKNNKLLRTLGIRLHPLDCDGIFIVFQALHVFVLEVAFLASKDCGDVTPVNENN